MVHKFACVYLKILPNQLSKGALYRKMLQHGFKLSTKHPPETNNHLESSYLKSISILVKIKLFTIFQLRLRYFVIKNKIGLKYFADIRFGMFLVKLNRKNGKFSEMKILQCIRNDVVFNYNDVIIIARCALTIESTQYVAILKLEWIL